MNTPISLSEWSLIVNWNVRYRVEFSRPHLLKPIPEGTVNVYFALICLTDENHQENGYDIEFQFESESLRHKLNNTMRKNMFEVSRLDDD